MSDTKTAQGHPCSSAPSQNQAKGRSLHHRLQTQVNFCPFLTPSSKLSLRLRFCNVRLFLKKRRKRKQIFEGPGMVLKQAELELDPRRVADAHYNMGYPYCLCAPGRSKSEDAERIRLAGIAWFAPRMRASFSPSWMMRRASHSISPRSNSSV